MSIPTGNGSAKSSHIEIRGARVNNLHNISVTIPRSELTVITGLSGSGKSSLAFDTLYAEGQRRFVESLSAYARQFLDRLSKPDVDSIVGLPPAVAIEQQSFVRNPRSTVATTTEIYDYLRLLYGRIGIVLDKETGEQIKKDSPEDVADFIVKSLRDSRIYILADLESRQQPFSELRALLLAGGFARVLIGDATTPVDLEQTTEIPKNSAPLYAVVDRLKVDNTDEYRSRLVDSLETAFSIGNGRILVRSIAGSGATDHWFSSKFEHPQSKTQYLEPEPRLFSFNNPFGACPVCQGSGRSVGIDDGLVFPDKSLSIKRGAIHPFRGHSFSAHLRALIRESNRANININDPLHTLTDREMKLVMEGVGQYIGVNGLFKILEDKAYVTHYRVILSRYRGYTRCKACNGSRLRTAARQVFVSGKNLPEVVQMSLATARDHFARLHLTNHEQQVIGHVLNELNQRLSLLCEIGLEYLTLDRLSHTLSGGESQRINLATSLGASLVGTLYVLDEPSIGLHSKDTTKLLTILKRLRGLGNTVVVVEHDPDIILAADNLIDIGPGAGEHGGQIVFSGKVEQLINTSDTLTAQYLSGKRVMREPRAVRRGNGKVLTIRNPRHNNLKGDDVEIPLGKMTVVTGVSGSGKSTLVHDVIYGGIRRILGSYNGEIGTFDAIEGLAAINNVEMIDQSPIGRSTRSTPATYTKVFDHIRDVFASTQAAKQLGWKPGHFSFNVAGGRCDLCEGDGVVTIDMQFMPDVTLPCESCNGTRYKREVAQILYKGKSIIDVLGMTVTEAMEHFVEIPRIVSKLDIMKRVGLGYLRLGQPSTHLSGGEAQRIKLATYLDATEQQSTLFIFDEPTTGLHVHDVAVLLTAFDQLVDTGNTVLIIEHNLHVIAAADYIIDLGPDGGIGGGHVIATGTPKQIAKVNTSYTGQALKSFIQLTDRVKTSTV